MQFYITDVFAEQKYQGNQLAVLRPDHELTTSEMQQIAREINFSETTFILSDRQDNGGYSVRIFTPGAELPFAGHPTLGTAFVIHRLLEGKKTGGGQVLLNLKAGPIPVSIDENGLMMKQNQPSFEMRIERESLIADILQIDKNDIDDQYPIQVVSTGLPCVITPLKTVDAVKRCSIDHSLFQHFIDKVYRCNLLVFAEDADKHLYVRVFVFSAGIKEDPATGSANGNLAGYLLKYNYFRKNKIQYSARQGHDINRPSLLRISASMAGDAFEIHVGGNVHLVAQGEWL